MTFTGNQSNSLGVSIEKNESTLYVKKNIFESQSLKNNNT